MLYPIQPWISKFNVSSIYNCPWASVMIKDERNAWAHSWALVGLWSRYSSAVASTYLSLLTIVFSFSFTPWHAMLLLYDCLYCIHCIYFTQLLSRCRIKEVVFVTHTYGINCYILCGFRLEIPRGHRPWIPVSKLPIEILWFCPLTTSSCYNIAMT